MMRLVDGLSVTVVSVDRITRVYVAGEIDVSNTERLLRTLTGEIRAGADDVVVDAGAVDFIGSMGVRVLILARELANEVGVGFCVTNPSPQVTAVFTMLGMEEAFAPTA